MANNGNGGIDYYELRRKHLEYKKNAGRAQDDEAKGPPPVPPAEDAPFVRPAPPAEDVREMSFDAEDAEEDRHTAYDSDADEDPEDDEMDNSGANPFHSFILTFNKIRERFAARREERNQEMLDDADEDDGDEEPQEERRGPFRFLKRHGSDAAEDEPEETFEDAYVAEDAPPPTAHAPAPAKEFAPPPQSVALDVPEEEMFPAAEKILVPDAMNEDEYEGADEKYEDVPPREGGFKRFVSLFIVREDRVREPDEEEEYQFDEPEIDIGVKDQEQEFDDSLFTRPREHGASEEEQDSMGEQENNKENLTDLMADSLDDGTLSRRERRLLRERQEAQKNAAEPESPDGATVDEPTREYKPVSRPPMPGSPEPVAEPIPSLFERDDSPRKSVRHAEVSADEEEPKPHKRGRRDDDYDDYDDEEPKSRKRGRRDDEDDDYDDEEPKSRKRGRHDDDYDDYDDEPAPRGRRRRDVEDDDYDEEPRRDRRYDDEYDDYEEDDYAPSFGHYVLGFFKVLIAVVLVLAVALFGLYFADQAVPGGVGAYGWLQEKLPVINKILPTGEDAASDTGDGDTLDLETTSPDESASPDASASPEATGTGTVG